MIDQFSNIVAKNSIRTVNESTLMKSTKVWEEKCKMQERSKNITQHIMYIKDVPKLCASNKTIN